jgi:hypothetical protein
VFKSELMTGYINTRANPLSTVTIGALRDLGYTVDFTKADPFTPATALRLPGVHVPGADDTVNGVAIGERLFGPRRTAGH